MVYRWQGPGPWRGEVGYACLMLWCDYDKSFFENQIVSDWMVEIVLFVRWLARKLCVDERFCIAWDGLASLW